MRLSLTLTTLLLLTPLTCQAQQPADAPAPSWKVGTAVAQITPQRRLHMRGYASRKTPAEGTEQELFGKAIAIEDEQGQRVVFVTLDLIGVLAELRATVAKEVQQQFKLPPQQLLMNASHTHCGPAYGREDAKDYFDSLAKDLVKIVGQAIERLEPARLTYSQARCSVAINRRTPTERGFLNHPNPHGPVDHTVPVLAAHDGAGKLKAVVFGYACHNTTMSFYRWLGDYAGFAQEYFQADHPGVTALFMMGCGGDQNPYPRRELKYAKMHGRSLATAVEAALETNQRTLRHQRPIRGAIKAAMGTVDLEFSDPKRPDFAYPVQVIRLGDELMLVALGTEVVVDYSLRLKRELGKQDGPAIWVAGYSNVYNGYIPSRRVLLEGGYEARSRPWKPELEQRIIGKVHALVGQLKGKQAASGK